MAKIPVEKESQGAAWWKWLLGALAVVLLAWIIWAWADDDEEELAIDEGIESVEEPATTDMATDQGGVITDVSTIFNAADRSELVGREVRLANMHVRQVPGDSVFYVSPEEGVPVAADNRVLIASLDEVIPTPPPGVEGRYDVTENQMLTIYGSVQRIEQEHPSAWGISQQESQQMLDEDQVYVRAQRLEIAEMPQEGENQRAMGQEEAQ